MANLEGDGYFSSVEEDEPLHVLDLPQLYTRPSASVLLSTLTDLSFEPPSWDRMPGSGTPRTGTPNSQINKKRKVKSEGVPNYLTKIISSPLAWINEDEEKEQIWDAASQRLSERSGRTGMGAISRKFFIPLVPDAIDTASASQGKSLPEETGDKYVEITIHEPALTSDNLGLKTWASSFLLARRLCVLRSSLPRLSTADQVLELGAGTGLVGLAAAAVLKTQVVLTDLPEIVPNLQRNAESNFPMIDTNGGDVETAVLDWMEPSAFSMDGGNTTHGEHRFPLIFAADPIYSPQHALLLVQAVNSQLSRESNARVVIELPIREAYAKERQDLRDRMMGIGLVVLDQGEEVGYDDWSDEHDEEKLAEVTCQWTVWGWAKSTAT